VLNRKEHREHKGKPVNSEKAASHEKAQNAQRKDGSVAEFVGKKLKMAA
jgi:hypothetical protein